MLYLWLPCCALNIKMLPYLPVSLGISQEVGLPVGACTAPSRKVRASIFRSHISDRNPAKKTVLGPNIGELTVFWVRTPAAGMSQTSP